MYSYIRTYPTLKANIERKSVMCLTYYHSVLRQISPESFMVVGKENLKSFIFHSELLADKSDRLAKTAKSGFGEQSSKRFFLTKKIRRRYSYGYPILLVRDFLNIPILITLALSKNSSNEISFSRTLFTTVFIILFNPHKARDINPHLPQSALSKFFFHLFFHVSCFLLFYPCSEKYGRNHQIPNNFKFYFAPLF